MSEIRCSVQAWRAFVLWYQTFSEASQNVAERAFASSFFRCLSTYAVAGPFKLPLGSSGLNDFVTQGVVTRVLNPCGSAYSVACAFQWCCGTHLYFSIRSACVSHVRPADARHRALFVPVAAQTNPQRKDLFCVFNVFSNNSAFLLFSKTASFYCC